MMSIISVLVFSGLIAYDNQRIRNVFEQTGGNVGQGWSYLWRFSSILTL